MQMIKRLNKSDGEDGHMNAWAKDCVTVEDDGDMWKKLMAMVMPMIMMTKLRAE